MILAFACVCAGLVLVGLGTAPHDHPAIAWLARLTPLERKRVPLLAFALGGLTLVGAIALVAWMARGISLD